MIAEKSQLHLLESNLRNIQKMFAIGYMVMSAFVFEVVEALLSLINLKSLYVLKKLAWSLQHIAIFFFE